ncbi:glycosyltransferase family 4 protein [Pseudanabaena sp. FACHB-1998]|uniref:glycosyltransferase family 4 protein n=1 Tax=Pseudanabaena sp. FACHB-1998 TaxID=2692858 RepID=UPI0016807084|nr:glycosyltransferase family 4 protein [Pseudanabaena sp. FACHB-1998]MBD2175767.1 glycosyltransferase family 4 protein [Pseudanabaena sp. FACHB-1998]
MKLKILNLLSDERMGGVKTSLNSLANSHLQEKFEFAIAPFNRVKASIKNLKPDIIIVHDACSWRILPNLLMLKLLKGKAKLIIQDHHYSEAFERLKVPNLQRFRLMLRLSHWCCDRLLLVSFAQSEWMAKYQLVRRKKVTVIQQSLNCDRFLSLRPKARGNLPVFAAYGRFNEQKGFDILLQAIQLIPHVNFRLLIAGYGEDETSLQQLAQGLAQIQFVGKVDDVPAFLEQSDVVIIPSRWEPWGNVCLEAKAAHKPVIVSAVDGLIEQVRGIGCGICVLPNDPQILAQAIAQFCQEVNAESLSSWGKEARESVRNAWEEHLNAWEDLLCQLLAK